MRSRSVLAYFVFLVSCVLSETKDIGRYYDWPRAQEEDAATAESDEEGGRR